MLWKDIGDTGGKIIAHAVALAKHMTNLKFGKFCVNLPKKADCNIGEEGVFAIGEAAKYHPKLAQISLGIF